MTEEDDIAKLRSDYTDLTGKNPFNGWDAAELRSRIDAELEGEPKAEESGKKQAPKKGKKQEAQMIPVRVNRDFWAGEKGNAERVRKGSVVEVPFESALDGIESGALSRVK